MQKQISFFLRTGLLGITCFCCICCSRKDSAEYKIARFDTDLYQYLTKNKPDTVLNKHIVFLNILGNGILDIGKTDSAGFYSRLKNYFSDSTLMRIYKDEQTTFADLSEINRELSKGLQVFLKQFPQIKPPKVYMHVSGFSQNVVVTDDILSLSADKYLGADYHLYQDYFYDYQRQLMSRDRVVPDYLLGFMMANLPFEGAEDVLLDRMLYEGKLRYLLSLLLPKRQEWEWLGYNKEQYEWCIRRQSQIWNTIQENHLLLTPNYLTTNQFLKEAPHTAFLPVNSPGKVGAWFGYRIISAFMKQNPQTSLMKLMENVNYIELLKESKYKPE